MTESSSSPPLPPPDPAEMEAYARSEAVDPAVARRIESDPALLSEIEQLRADEAFLVEAARAHVSREPALPGVLTPGEVILGYDILDSIDSGGQGTIYKALHRPTRRLVAIKLIRDGAFADARQRARFAREIEAVAALRHPNIVMLFDAGTLPGGRTGYVMEYIEGRTLRAILAAGDALPGDHDAPEQRNRHLTRPQRNRLRLFLEVVDAIRHAHEHGVVHRDLKPENILVDAAGVAHLLDFGLAKRFGSGIDDDSAQITMTGDFFFTLAHAAPEQFLPGDETSVRTDVYALGLVLYELLTGRLPYRTDGSIEDLMSDIRLGRLIPPRRFVPDLLPDLSAVVMTALETSPSRRYPSAGALAADVMRVVRGESVLTRAGSGSPLRRVIRRHRGWFAAGAAVVLTLIGITIFQIRDARIARQHAREVERRTTLTQLAQGRILADQGAVFAAEEFFWPVLLESVGDAATEDSARRRLLSDPFGRAAWWGLWSVYRQHPAETMTLLPPGTRVLDATDDGARLLVASDTEVAIVEMIDGAVCCRAPITQRMIAGRFDQRDQVRAFLVSQGGSMLIVKPTDEVDAPIVERIPGPGGLVTACAMARTPTPVLFLGFGNGRIARIDPATKHVQVFPRHDLRSIRKIAVSGDGRRIATMTAAMIMIRDAATLEVIDVLDGQHRGGVALDEDGSGVFTVRGDRVMRLPVGRPLEVGAEPWVAAGWSMDAMDVRFDPTTQHVGLLDRQLGLFMWGKDTAQPALRVNVAVRGDAEMRMLAGGRIIVDLQRQHWREATVFSQTAGVSRGLHVPGETTFDIRLHPDGDRFLAVHADFELGGFVSEWTLDGVRRQPDLHLEAGIPSGVAYSPAAKRGLNDEILISDYAGQLQVRDPKVTIAPGSTPDASRSLFSRPDAQLSTVDSHAETGLVAWCDDRGFVGVCNEDGDILWEHVDVEPVAPLRVRRAKVRISPDGKTVGAVSNAGELLLWNADDGTNPRRVRLSESVLRTLEWTKDGRFILVGGDDRRIDLINARSLKVEASLGGQDGHFERVNAIRVHPTEPTLVLSGSEDGAVLLWDLELQSVIARIHQIDGAVFTLEYSSDGGIILVGGEFGTLDLIDVTAGARLISRYARNWIRDIGGDSNPLADAIQVNR